MKLRTTPGAGDLVPLADRIRWMRWFRLSLTVVALLALHLLPEARQVPFADVVWVTGGYAVLMLVGEGIWRLANRRALTLSGLLLLVDGLYLAWISYAMAGADSPLRHLIILHLVAVSLLASFRTGLKLALWHSILLFCTFYAREAGLLDASAGPALGDAEFRSLLAYVASFWIVALATAALAAANERELRRRRYDLEALRKLSSNLAEAEAPAEAAEALVGAVAEEFGFKRVVLFAAPQDELFLLAHRGAAASAGEAAESPLLTRAGASAEPLLVSGLSPGADPFLPTLLPRARNLVCVPLLAEGRTVGVLVCEHGLRRGSRIERRVVTMLERFASQAALTLTGTWLLERLERLAATDGLTGVANRATFDATLGKELARAARATQAVSLVMVDIDHFKRLNDNYGHLTGDETLRVVASTLDSEVRGFDVVARYGGEEFAVILPGLGADQAYVVAERLRTAVAGCGTEPAVTASVGVATYPTDADDGVSLVAAADAALYASKRAGRDRTTRAGVG